MKNTIEWAKLLLYMGAFAFIVYLVFQVNDTKDELLEYWENPNFKTDTIIYEIAYPDLPKIDFKFNIPPQSVIIYPNQPAPHISINLNDSLITVIDSLKQQITTINSRYLKLYPVASKLIHGEFHADSLSLDLLSIDGVIRTHKYGVNYDRFKYQWKDGTLQADPIRSKSTPSFGIYAYGGYDFLGTNVLLGVDAGLHKKNWRLLGNTFFTIEKKPELNVQLTLGHRIR